MSRRIRFLLSSTLALVGCVDADREDAPDESSIASDLTGPTTFDGSCHAQDVPALATAVFQGQIAANSQAFAECISTTLAQFNHAGDPGLNIGPYRACSHDPVNTTLGTVLAVARSQNPMTLTCDYSAIGTSRGGSAGLGDISLVDTSSTETISLGSLLADLSNTAAVADTIWHEVMHQHGYDHYEYGDPDYWCGITDSKPSYGNGIPYIVGECMFSVLNKSKAQCPQMTTGCPDGLQLVESVYPDASSCACVPAPQRQIGVGPRISASVDPNGGIRYGALDGSRAFVNQSSSWFSEWSSSFNGKFSAPPTILAGVRGAGTIDVVGQGTDGRYYHRASASGTWQALPGGYIAPPSVVSWGPNRIDVFGLGTDHRLYHLTWMGSWSGIEYVGGVFNGPPTVTVKSGTSLDIVGRGTDNRYYQKGYNGYFYYPYNTEDWTLVGPQQFVSEPAVASKQSSFDVVGLGPDMRYYHERVGMAPEVLPGVFMGPPAIGWQGGGARLDVVGQGTNGWYYLQQMSSTGAWSPLVGLSMAGYGAATIVSPATGANDVIIEGYGHRAYYQRITGTTANSVVTIPGNTFLD